MLEIKVMTQSEEIAQFTAAPVFAPLSSAAALAAARERGLDTGAASFSLDGDLLTVARIVVPDKDEQVADGLIRTALNWGEHHGARRAEFAPAVDRELLRRLYGEAAANGIEDVSFFFATCKNCANSCK